MDNPNNPSSSQTTSWNAGDEEEQQPLLEERFDDLVKTVENLLKEQKEQKEQQDKLISDLQEQFNSLQSKKPHEAAIEGKPIACIDNLSDPEENSTSRHNQDVREVNGNDIHIVYDISCCLCLIFRFLAFYIGSFSVTAMDNKAPSLILLPVSVIFESMTSVFEKKIMKIANFATLVGLILLMNNNNRPYLQTQDVVSASPSYQAMVAIAALLISLGQIVIVVGVFKDQKSYLRIASYVCYALSCIYLLYGRCVVSPLIAFTIVGLAAGQLHPLLLFFGLPDSNYPKKSTSENNHSANEELISIHPIPETTTNSISDFQDTTNTPNLTNHNHQHHQKPPSSYIQHRRNRLSILYGVQKSSTIKGELERDMYTFMMLSHWKRRSFRIPKWCCCSWCKNKSYVVFIPVPSKSWLMGIFVFVIQFALGLLIIVEQFNDPAFDTFLNIPPKTSSVVIVGQLMTVMLAFFSQTDITITLRNLLLLWYGYNPIWNKIIGEEHDNSFRLWFGRIFLPNVLKIIQGITILITSFIIIIQSEDIVTLLKEFTALFVISSVDDIFFIMADHGYFGIDLSKKSKKLKAIQIEEDDGKIRKILQFVLYILMVILLGVWIYVIILQFDGRLFLQQHPLCPINAIVMGLDNRIISGSFRRNRKYSDFLMNDICDFQFNEGPNTAECGWEAGDCVELNEKSQKYPSCTMTKNIFDPISGDWKQYFSFVGNGICDFGMGVGPNIEECGFDGGDCLVFNEQYPNCTESQIFLIANGRCDAGTNIEECGYDGNDCLQENLELQADYPNCSVHFPSWVGDGICDGFEYNTTECDWDGGDCLKLQNDFPQCKAKKSNVGNGRCGGRIYNTKECGWDGGDCFEFNHEYPFCKTDFPLLVGDGRCNEQNNVMECDWDGGDCLEFNEKYPNCKVDHTFFVGDGWCDGLTFNPHYVPECGFEGGNCNNVDMVKAEYPKCSVSFPENIGNGFCNGGEFNVEECGWDGGDCVEFNEQYPNCRNNTDFFTVIGNGFCESLEYNVEECGYDGGDCLEFNRKYPDCRVGELLRIGDGFCDGGIYNVEECGFDGGDCEH